MLVAPEPTSARVLLFCQEAEDPKRGEVRSQRVRVESRQFMYVDHGHESPRRLRFVDVRGTACPFASSLALAASDRDTEASTVSLTHFRTSASLSGAFGIACTSTRS